MALFTASNNEVIDRSDIAMASIDIGGRDILMGFNEPAFKIIETEEPDI